MVKGLDLFRDHFRDFADRYVLIGGTACDLVMGTNQHRPACADALPDGVSGLGVVVMALARRYSWRG